MVMIRVGFLFICGPRVIFFAMGSQLDKKYLFFVLGSEVDKPSKNFIKTLNALEYLESDIQNIEAPKIDDLIL